MGTRSGIYVYNAQTKKPVLYNPAVLKNATINRIIEDKQGNYWFGTLGSGLYTWTREKARRNFADGFSKVSAIPTQLITGSFIDRNGYLWVSTLGSGVYKLDPPSGKVLLHLDSKGEADQRLLDDGVGAMVEFNDSTMAIAAGGLNFYSTRTGKMKYYTLKEGLPSTAIVSMEKDKMGILWMGLLNGLSLYYAQNNSFMFFDREDGMVSDNFSGGVSALRSDGTVLFGTGSDLLEFNAEYTKCKFTPGTVEITDFKIAGQSFPLDSLLQKKTIELNAKENFVTIQFSPVSYMYPFAVYYKLEGLDDEWRPADGLNQAIYSYLPSGNYTFKVKAEGYSGYGMAQRTSIPLSITVHPPFYRTWWFYGLLLLAAAGLFYLYDRTKLEKWKALQHIRTQIGADLHHEINNTLSNIYMLSEMARIKADNNSILSKEYISQIHDKSRRMIVAMDDMLWSLDPENDSMEKSICRMKEYVEALRNEHKACIDLAIAPEVRNLKLSMKNRLAFFIIFKEALQAVVEFAGGRKTLVIVEPYRNGLTFRLHDSTASFSEECEYIRKSIDKMQHQAQQIDADIDVQTDRIGVSMILMAPAG
jgi:hypothetical protein